MRIAAVGTFLVAFTLATWAIRLLATGELSNLQMVQPIVSGTLRAS